MPERAKINLGIGNIYLMGENLQFRVESIKDIPKLISFLDEYSLITQKQEDYFLFKQVVNLDLNGEHLTMEGLCKIIAIKASMNRGLSINLKYTFPGVLPVERPLILHSVIPNAQWLAGFTSAEWCFSIGIKKSKSHKLGVQVQLNFVLTQHIRDEQLISRIIMYLNCGKISKTREAVRFKVENFTDLIDKIIPFFKNYQIIGVKAKDFDDWCKAAELVKIKAHLTEDGLNKICEIQKGMNSRRK